MNEDFVVEGGELANTEEISGETDESRVNGVCDEDTFTRMTVPNCLQRIGSKPITFENAPPSEKSGIAIAQAGKVC